MKSFAEKHPDFLIAQKLAYDPNGFVCKNFVQAAESQEYAACQLELNDYRIVFRVAKITPTKMGQFVTLWKRIDNGPIMPFDLLDPIDFFIISVRSGEQLGQFIFPKNILHKKDYVSHNGHGGKRAMRVYQPWDKVESKQAKKTQAWQIQYFCVIQPNFDEAKMKRLF